MKRLLPLSLFALAFACSNPDTPPLSGSPDSGDLEDLTEPVDASKSLDGAGQPDLRENNSGDTAYETVNVDFSSFELTPPCEGVRDLDAASSAEFEIPSRPLEEPLPTRSNLVERLGDPLPIVNAISPESRHQPGPGQAVDLWARPGEDISIHVAFGFPRKQELETFRFNLVLMVDYQPVEATYIRWDDEREQKLDERLATGVRYPMIDDVELVEIVIPAQAFPEARAYEIGVSFEVTNLAQARITGASRRLVLYYGGFERGEAPCVPTILDVEASGHERAIWGYFVGSNLVFLAYDGMPRDPDTPKRVAPGSTVEFLASHFRLAHQRVPSMIQPVLNGRPVGASQLLSYGAAGGGFPQTIDARTTFEITFPEEPGEYEVLAMTWPYAYQLARTPEGEVDPNVEISPNHANSNPLHFIVDDSL